MIKAGFNRHSLSSTLSLFLFLLLVLFGFYVEYFYSKSNTQKSSITFESPIKPDLLARVSTIKIKNKLGSFLLAKKNDQWIMEEPKKLPADNSTLKSIFNALDNISIRTLHPMDEINKQNFSLNNPLTEIFLYTKLEESIHLKFGLVNPITNNTFLHLNEDSFIFEVGQLLSPLEQLELSNLIDTRIFNFNLKEIKEFNVTHYSQNEPYNSLTQTDEGWKSKRYNTINDKSVDKKLSAILNIPPHLILDTVTPEIKNYIDNYLRNPRYQLQITTTEGKKINYKVSVVTKSIDQIKVENKTYVIIVASNRPYPFMVHKDYLSEFLIRYQDLK